MDIRNENYVVTGGAEMTDSHTVDLLTHADVL
jgi:hypothetical protein